MRTSRRVLNASRWSVVGYDQRGHGRSPGERGRLAAVDDLLVDLAPAIDAVRAEHAGGPLVLLGHSLGGLVGARFVAGALERPRPTWQRAGRRARAVVACARHRHEAAAKRACWRRSAR